MKSEIVKFKDLKKGEKFYYYDEMIYTLLDLTVIHGNPDKIALKLKKFKTNEIINMDMHGPDINNRTVYRYTGRDSSSFFAGFRAALAICTPHMGVFDLENAEVDNVLTQHMTTLKAYNVWKENNFNDNCNKI